MIRRAAGPFAILLAGWLLLGAQAPAAGHEPAPSPLARGAMRRAVHLPIPDFSLTDQEGRPFSFRSVKGKVVLVSFIYTSCPDICPLMTASARLVQGALSARERPAVFFLSITTDPEVDTPAVLKSYAARYRIDPSNWSFLTAGPQSLAAVWKAFGVKAERKARGLVNHTPLTALIDKEGVMRFAYYGTAPDHTTVLRDLRALMSLR